MQETRRLILDIMRKRGSVTVDELVDALRALRGDDITSVTVRHHLARLQHDSLITSPQLRRRASPGRPQHIYTLTSAAKEQFPSNYQHLFSTMLEEMRRQLPPEGVNVILEGVAERWAGQAEIPELPLEDRMDLVVKYLNEHGYEAYWETGADGLILHTTNCPYHQIADQDSALCELDMRLVSLLLKTAPRRLAHRMTGDQMCSYLVPVARPLELPAAAN